MWTMPTPRTTGELITASIWNTDLRDNLVLLKTSIANDGKLASIGGTLTTPTIETPTITGSPNIAGGYLSVSGGNARIVFNDTAQPVDLRKYLIMNANQNLYFHSVSDAEGGIGLPLYLTRGGDAVVGRNVNVAGSIVSGPMYPGRYDSAWAQQSAWYLGSHASFGLFTGTGFYATGPLWTAQGVNVDGYVREKSLAATISGGVATIDIGTSANWSILLNQNLTSLAIGGYDVGRANFFTVRFRQDGAGGRTVALPNIFVQPGWTMSPRPNAIDVLCGMLDPGIGFYMSPFITNIG